MKDGDKISKAYTKLSRKSAAPEKKPARGLLTVIAWIFPGKETYLHPGDAERLLSCRNRKTLK